MASVTVTPRDGAPAMSSGTEFMAELEKLVSYSEPCGTHAPYTLLWRHAMVKAPKEKVSRDQVLKGVIELAQSSKKPLPIGQVAELEKVLLLSTGHKLPKPVQHPAKTIKMLKNDPSKKDFAAVSLDDGDASDPLNW
eukprot:gene24165-41266_t